MVEKQLKGNIVWEKMAYLYYKTHGEPDPGNKMAQETIQAELQEIWDIIENIIKKTAWKTLEKKKVKKIKGDDNNKAWQPKEIYNYRDARLILKLVQTASKGNKKNTSIEDLNKICKEVSRLNKKCPELHLSNYGITHSIEQIPWLSWIKELEGAIISLKDECYKKENIRKRA